MGQRGKQCSVDGLAGIAREEFQVQRIVPAPRALITEDSCTRGPLADYNSCIFINSRLGRYQHCW